VVAQIRSLAFAASDPTGNGDLAEFNALLDSLGGNGPADSPAGRQVRNGTEVFANLLDEIRSKENP